jgi:dTDP-D-glucose 4,6-dehydratase
MATGWKPQYEIEKSVRITARWLKDNSWIFKN